MQLAVHKIEWQKNPLLQITELNKHRISCFFYGAHAVIVRPSTRKRPGCFVAYIFLKELALNIKDSFHFSSNFLSLLF